MRPAEEIKRLIKNLTDKTSAKMDERVLKDVLCALEESRKNDSAFVEPKIRSRIMKNPITKLAAMISLICMGVVAAAVVGIKIHNYRVVDKDPERGYILVSEDGRKSINIHDNHADSPEQAIEYAEEIALLKQQGDRELVLVGEIEVNGRHDSRILQYKYNLSDGRTIKVGERDPDDDGPMTLVGERLKEAGCLLRETAVARARSTGLFVTTDEGTFYVPDEQEEEQQIPTYEQVIQGRIFIFQKYTFTLSDGTEVAWALGQLPEDSPSGVGNTATNEKPIPDDLREWASLRKEGKGQLIAVDELTANGELDRRVFVYRYQLSDGRTMDLREGTGDGNYALNSKQRQEWVQCKNSGSGQDLGTYEQKVKDRLFVFKKQKFVLSDGTEIIWSYGTLKEKQ